ncbi:hypothetical protein EYF80_002691 [Liparis tanakae]|uniref:Uncharacterized protein n=1 Tax=Liparis tanakae TaxID=230148 RepID=A0A4Z2J9P1_9TELE|nr:hypothetical protein EYF80_002691 [Liparis tanakae]
MAMSPVLSAAKLTGKIMNRTGLFDFLWRQLSASSLDSLTRSPWQHPRWHRVELEGDHGCAASAHQEMRTCILHPSKHNLTPPCTARSSDTDHLAAVSSRMC